MSDLSAVLRSAVEALKRAGVASARADATTLAALVLGVETGEVHRLAVLGHEVEPALIERFEALVTDRAARVPLQHLTGVAHFRTITLAVGPGVFVPRPETEVLVELGLAALVAMDRPGSRPPRVVDLCTGSGAIALALAVEHPVAEVSAVELDPHAHAWAVRNVEAVGAATGAAVDLRLGPAQQAFPELDGCVDLVVSNPPYIPEGMVPQDPEVQDHDPHLALYGGGRDGLEVPRLVIERAAALLRPGGVFLMEHADTQGEWLVAALGTDDRWDQVRDHRDLSDRPRVLRAVRSDR